MTRALNFLVPSFASAKQMVLGAERGQAVYVSIGGQCSFLDRLVQYLYRICFADVPSIKNMLNAAISKLMGLLLF